MIRRPPRSTLFPLHDALPISPAQPKTPYYPDAAWQRRAPAEAGIDAQRLKDAVDYRSEEHTSELQSHSDLVCRLLLEKKKKKTKKKALLTIKTRHNRVHENAL